MCVRVFVAVVDMGRKGLNETYGRPVAVKRWRSTSLVSGTIRGAAEEAMDAVSGFAILCVVDIVCGNVNCKCA